MPVTCSNLISSIQKSKPTLFSYPSAKKKRPPSPVSREGFGTGTTTRTQSVVSAIALRLDS